MRNIIFAGMVLCVLAGAASCIGCAGASVQPPPSRPAAQSWDQANLKNHDVGCPSAVFIAPNGFLIECQHVEIPPGLPPEVEALIRRMAANSEPYETMEEAATAGLKLIASKPLSVYYEYGGVITRNVAGKYVAHAPDTDYAGDHVRLSHESESVASYHTHPCLTGHDVEYFSPEDMYAVVFQHHVAFMGDFCTGSVHEIKPGDKPDAEQPKQDEQDVWLSKGRIIGTFTTTHEVIG